MFVFTCVCVCVCVCVCGVCVHVCVCVCMHVCVCYMFSTTTYNRISIDIRFPRYSEYEVYGDLNVVASAQVNTRYSTNSLFGIISDVFVLAHSDFAVCTFSSNVSNVQLFSNAKAKSVILIPHSRIIIEKQF